MLEIDTSLIDNLVQYFKQAEQNIANIKVTGQTDINQNLSQIAPNTTVEISNGVAPIITQLAQLKLREVQAVHNAAQVQLPQQVDQPDAELQSKGANPVKIVAMEIAEAVLKSIFKSGH